LQKLENQYAEGLIDLYYGDESHVCTGGYVPYGWLFRGEDYYVPSDQKFRLNCSGIIDRDSNNSDRIIEYLDGLSLRIRKKTVVVLDNAKIHRPGKSCAIVNFGRREDFSSAFFLHTLLISTLPKRFGEYSRESG
jgi:hypothetical protein